jgi:sugar phosphate permease
MKDAGLDISTAANVTALFQIGGTIGAIIVGWAMDRTIGVLSSLLSVLVFSAGFCMSVRPFARAGENFGCAPRQRGPFDDHRLSRPLHDRTKGA